MLRTGQALSSCPPYFVDILGALVRTGPCPASLIRAGNSAPLPGRHVRQNPSWPIPDSHLAARVHRLLAENAPSIDWRKFGQAVEHFHHPGIVRRSACARQSFAGWSSSRRVQPRHAPCRGTRRRALRPGGKKPGDRGSKASHAGTDIAGRRQRRLVRVKENRLAFRRACRHLDLQQRVARPAPGQELSSTRTPRLRRRAARPAG